MDLREAMECKSKGVIPLLAVGAPICSDLWEEIKRRWKLTETYCTPDVRIAENLRQQNAVWDVRSATLITRLLTVEDIVSMTNTSAAILPIVGNVYKEEELQRIATGTQYIVSSPTSDGRYIVERLCDEKEVFYIRQENACKNKEYQKLLTRGMEQGLFGPPKGFGAF